jgi:hypothetical protein
MGRRGAAADAIGILMPRGMHLSEARRRSRLTAGATADDAAATCAGQCLLRRDLRFVSAPDSLPPPRSTATARAV